MMSSQFHISSPIVVRTAFTIHLDPRDIDFLKRKLSVSQDREKSPMRREGQSNPNVKIIVFIEQAIGEGSARKLTKPLQTQLQKDRDRRITNDTLRKKGIIQPGQLSLLTSTQSVDSPTRARVPSTVPCTNAINVVISALRA